jgi:hypothetical protein
MDIFTMIMACSLYPDNSITNAIIQTGSHEKSFVVTSVSADGMVTKKDKFANVVQAADYTQAEIDKGSEVAIGLMQIPHRWLADYQGRASLEELFRPCKNMTIATDVLNKVARQCFQQDDDSPNCMLSVYRTGDPKQGQAYAETVLKYAEKYPMKGKAQHAVPQLVDPELPEPDFGVRN